VNKNITLAAFQRRRENVQHRVILVLIYVLACQNHLPCFSQNMSSLHPKNKLAQTCFSFLSSCPQQKRCTKQWVKRNR